MKYVTIKAEGGFKYNIAKIPLDKARAYAEKMFNSAGKNLDELLPDFDTNYNNLQKACGKAIDIPRIEMPVIEPEDIKKFQNDLAKGKVDIFAPFARGKLVAPKNLDKDRSEAKKWIRLGYADGDETDDKLKGKLTKVSANKLIPTQSQIWLEKVITNIIKFGLPKAGSPVSEATLIASKEGYILDGHHRYGQAMIGNPTLKMRALIIPIDIKTLVKIARSYGNYLGNQQKG